MTSPVRRKLFSLPQSLYTAIESGAISERDAQQLAESIITLNHSDRSTLEKDLLVAREFPSSVVKGIRETVEASYKYDRLLSLFPNTSRGFGVDKSVLKLELVRLNIKSLEDLLNISTTTILQLPGLRQGSLVALLHNICKEQGTQVIKELKDARIQGAITRFKKNKDEEVKIQLEDLGRTRSPLARNHLTSLFEHCIKEGDRYVLKAVKPLDVPLRDLLTKKKLYKECQTGLEDSYVIKILTQLWEEVVESIPET